MDVRDARGEYRVEPAPAATATGIPLGYKRTEVGVIPTDWHEETLLALANVMMDFRGRTPKKLGMTWGGGYIPALSAKNVKMGFIDFDEECYFGSLDLYGKWMTKGGVEFGDVIFTTEAPLGNVAQIPDSRKYILSQRTILLRANSQKADNAFLAQLMRSARFQSMLATLASGSTAKGIKRTTFEKIAIALPGPDEQRAIAEALSDVDALLGALDRLIAKKRDLKQAAMQQLLTGQTRLPGFHGEWKVKTLGEVFLITVGTSKSSSIVENGDHWIVDMGSVSVRGELLVSKQTNLSSDFLCVGDLVMPKDDIGGGGIIGRVGYIDADKTYVLGDHVYCLRATEGDPRFFAYLINSQTVNHALRKKAIGSAQLGLGRRSVTDQEIAFPDPGEQAAIAAVLSDIDAEIKGLEARSAKTRDLKQAMMQELLTGRIRLV